MEFVKGTIHPSCQILSWYLHIDKDPKTLLFISQLLSDQMSRIIFDPHKIQSMPNEFDSILLQIVPKTQMSLLLGERNGWYMNKKGGMSDNIYSIAEIINSDTWPEQNRIEILKWPKGKHYYVKIDGIDVTDNDGNQKWNTKKQAEEAANYFLTTLQL